MSDDLISRKTVIELIESNIKNQLQGYEDIPMIYANPLIADIGDIKTAYDADKVIQNIEERKQFLAKNIRLNTQEYNIEREVEDAMMPYDSCIDIVKGGGV